MQADGRVWIDTKITTDGVEKGFDRIRNKSEDLAVSTKRMGDSIRKNFAQADFSKPVANAVQKVKSLEQKLAAVTSEFNLAVDDGDDKAAERLAAKRVSLYDKVESAREKLAIEVAAAANKEAASTEKAASREKKSYFSALSVIKTALKSVLKVVGGIKRYFSDLGKSTSGFGSRLKSIVSGAFVFNLISAGLRRVTEYFQSAILSTKEMKQAMANLRVAAASAVAPIVQLLTPALSTLANATARVLAYLSQFISLFTGKIASASKAVSKAAGAAKKVSRSLAGFDEITRLGDKDSGGGGSSPSVKGKVPDVKLPDWAKTMVDHLKAGKWSEAATVLTDKLNSMVQSVDWAGVGKKIAYWFDGALEFLATAILTFDWYALGTSLATAINSIINNVNWGNLGVVLGAKIITLIGILGGLFATIDWGGLGSAIADGFMGLWNAINWQQAAKTLSGGLIGAIEALTVVIQTIDWQKIGNDIALFIATIDWSGLMVALSNGIGAALAGLAALLWGLIEDAWDSVVGWWQEVAYKDGEFTMDGLLLGIGNACKNIGKWIKEKIFDPFIEGFRNAFKINSPSKVMEEEGGFVIAGLFNGITNAWNEITRFFENAVKWFRTTFGNLTKIAGDSWRGIQQTWSTVSGWFNQTIISPLTQAFTNLWSNLSKWATDAWAGIRKVFGSVGDWFGKTFGDAWEKVKKVFSSGGKVFDGIKDGIVSSFKTIVNKLISGINRVVAKPFEGLNTAIRKIRSVNVMGLSPFSGLSTVSVPSIPYLAQGAVLPANKPFMAVVGDQRHGTNVEAPLATIQEAVANVMGDSIASNMAGHEATVAVLREILSAVLGIEIGDAVIGEAAARYNNQMAIMRGI